MSAVAAGAALAVFSRATTQTSYMQKQLVPSIGSRWEQVVLPSPTAPSSLTWPPPSSPCQDHITPQTWNKIGILEVVLFSRPIPLHWILSRCFLKVLINTQEPRVFIQLRHLEITLKGRQIFRRRKKKKVVDSHWHYAWNLFIALYKSFMVIH